MHILMYNSSMDSPLEYKYRKHLQRKRRRPPSWERVVGVLLVATFLFGLGLILIGRAEVLSFTPTFVQAMFDPQLRSQAVSELTGVRRQAQAQGWQANLSETYQYAQPGHVLVAIRTSTDTRIGALDYDQQKFEPVLELPADAADISVYTNELTLYLQENALYYRDGERKTNLISPRETVVIDYLVDQQNQEIYWLQPSELGTELHVLTARGELLQLAKFSQLFTEINNHDGQLRLATDSNCYEYDLAERELSKQTCDLTWPQLPGFEMNYQLPLSAPVSAAVEVTKQIGEYDADTELRLRPEELASEIRYVSGNICYFSHDQVIGIDGVQPLLASFTCTDGITFTDIFEFNSQRELVNWDWVEDDLVLDVSDQGFPMLFWIIPEQLEYVTVRPDICIGREKCDVQLLGGEL